MAAKAILLLFLQTLTFQSVFTQCISRAAVDSSGFSSGSLGTFYDRFVASLARLVGPEFPSSSANNGIPMPYGLAGAGLATPYGLASPVSVVGSIFAPGIEFTASSGGIMPVTSTSAMPAVGITVVSDNYYEGTLYVVGELPFVGTTAMEGVVPSSGAGAINHACGDGIDVVVGDIGIAPTAMFAPAAGIATAAAYDPAAAVLGPITGPAFSLGYGYGYV